jgi:hypothetical protein
VTSSLIEPVSQYHRFISSKGKNMQILKKLLQIGSLLAFLTCSVVGNAQSSFNPNMPVAPGPTSLNYNDSPLNYQNSELNYQNSPLNYQNSPLNYQNSSMNYNATNNVYDNNGNRVGYEVKAPSGVTNYFDNNGNRVGYSPSNR